MTGYNPLRAYVHRDGFARFCTAKSVLFIHGFRISNETDSVMKPDSACSINTLCKHRYSASPADLDNVLMHLTNVAVQVPPARGIIAAPQRRAARAPRAITHEHAHTRAHTHTNARTQARARARAHTHTHTQTRTHARTHAHTPRCAAAPYRPGSAEVAEIRTGRTRRGAMSTARRERE